MPLGESRIPDRLDGAEKLERAYEEEPGDSGGADDAHEEVGHDEQSYGCAVHDCDNGRRKDHQDREEPEKREYLERQLGVQCAVSRAQRRNQAHGTGKHRNEEQEQPGTRRLK